MVRGVINEMKHTRVDKQRIRVQVRTAERCDVSPSKGGLPTRNSYVSTPRLHTSAVRTSGERIVSTMISECAMKV